ncbi:hypothetical protein [Aurantiacibacter poecillastricola]|uniref:hypothetical protein n=1 Tax=Aurantiacibacter poecillastricola TaxID=3064385 RepID=UPI00273FD9F7|nr:hypothetical protein [Aurantiacibacter sp. 219JJ12-13]MDP5261201.1 hypothetical protein [Aurantiacibacter sp. 219JJ12-13]
MASVSFSAPMERGELRFFLVMACAMAATIVGGFSLDLATGRSTFAVPIIVHLHAVIFMGWVGLYLAQNALVFGGNRKLHRKLGWVSLIWVPLMVAAGLAIMRFTLQQRGGPPFFDQNQFLVSNPVALFTFAGLVAWAVTMRRDTGWHRRLMFVSFAMLTGPGWGRLLPMPLLIPYGWYISAILLPLIFPLIGMLADKRRHGRVHPAWLWAIGIFVGLQILADLIAYSPVGYQFTEWFLAGTPGADRQMQAFAPPM